LGGETHRQPLFQSGLFVNAESDIAGRGFWGACATWEDGDGTRWVYAPAWGGANAALPAFPKANGPMPNGALLAVQVKEENGRAVLAPAWSSHDINLPEPAVIAN